MAPLSEFAELRAAWRALAGEEEQAGWRTIPIGSRDQHVRAGRHYPEGVEALLIGFRDVTMPRPDSLPKGRGFVVGRVESGDASDGRTWVSLTREPDGRLELFAVIAEDLLAELHRRFQAPDQQAFRVFLERINAWQAFMQRERKNVLSAEAEVGLAGELLTFLGLVDEGIDPASAIDGWVGPLDAPQDFRFGEGAVEVKTTVAVGTFPANVSSLEQLDDSLVKPLFLAAVRLAIGETGRTLPEIAADVRDVFSSNPEALTVLNTRLVYAGLLSSETSAYRRRFEHLATRVMRVTEAFPRLTSANVPHAVREARYTIDLELVDCETLSLSDVVTELGAQ